MDRIYEYLNESLSQMINDLQVIVEHETPTRNKALNDRLGRYIGTMLQERIGVEASYLNNDIYGDQLWWEWGTGEQQILVLGHLDTVYPEGELSHRPFRVNGDHAFGPGVLDMKSGIIQAIYAFQVIQDLGIKLSSRIVFLLTADEEIGSPTSRNLIEEEARRSNYVLVLEPATYPDDAVKTARKGAGRFKLDIVGKSAHAGIAPESGISAIEELASKIKYLHSLNDPTKGRSVNVGVLGGGTTSNVVAASAWADIDLRVTSTKDANELVPMILSIQPELPGAVIEVTGGLSRPPMERTEQIIMLYNKTKKIAEEKLGFELKEASTGGASDGNFTAPYSPTLDGLGGCGNGAHSHEEYVKVSQMPIRSALLAHLIIDLASN